MKHIVVLIIGLLIGGCTATAEKYQLTPAPVSVPAWEQSRTFDNVSAVFRDHQEDIFTLYNNALRQNPTLEGRAVFDITINSAGQVQNVVVLSSQSTLHDIDLLTHLRALFLQFDFGEVRDARTLIVTYPIEFLPPKKNGAPLSQ